MVTWFEDHYGWPTQKEAPIAHVLVAPDKFRHSASAHDVAAAAGRAAIRRGHEVRLLPLADGGEGLLEVVGGREERRVVTGPLGARLEAPFRVIEANGDRPRTAVIEMALASGLALVGGAAGNDPVAATTRGTGELIVAALDAGARRIVVGLGGSATTDGGLGAIEAIAEDPRLREVELVAACDVTTRFVDAASVFAPQKGADDETITRLTERLVTLEARYREEYGVDVSAIPGGGAAGGLGGGLAVLGATLASGFSLVADLLGLDGALADADLVITGEGRLDATSFAGKVVGGVREACAGRVRLGCVVGQATPEARALAGDMAVLSLTERFGLEASMRETTACIETLVGEYLDGLEELR